MSSRFVRKVRTASGAVAVQVVLKEGGRVVEVDHVGSAHTDAELALLLQTAGERLAPGQGVLDLGPLPQRPVATSEVADWTKSGDLGVSSAGGRPRSVVAGGRVVDTSAQVLWQVLMGAYEQLGFDVIDDEAFRALVLARIVEPSSKADSLRVLAELGVPGPSLRTVFRSLQRCVERDYRGMLAKAALARSAATAAGRASSADSFVAPGRLNEMGAQGYRSRAGLVGAL